MSYSEDDILRPDEWPIAGGSGTWNRRHSQSSQQQQQWPSAGTYATLTRPPPPAKPHFLSGSSGRNHNNLHQPQYSRSQHHLNYAPPVIPAMEMPTYKQMSHSGSGHSQRKSQPPLDEYQHPPTYSRIFRRFSDADDAAAAAALYYHLPANNNGHNFNAHSSSSSAHYPSPASSSSSSSFKPVVNMKQVPLQQIQQQPQIPPQPAVPPKQQDLRAKPIPPPKPPRTSLDQRNDNSLNRNLIQSKSQRNLAFSGHWNKTIDFGDVPPPEGYGNIKRSASNDVEGFLTTFSGYNSSSKGTSSSFTRPAAIDHENAHRRLPTDVFVTDHLYDEISTNGGSYKTSNGDNNASLTTNKIIHSSAPPTRKITPPHQALHQIQQQREQQLPQVDQISSNKHLRSRSEHHPRCPNSTNHYEVPFKLRGLSVERLSDPSDRISVVVPETPAAVDAAPVKQQPVVIPATRRASYDEYATVMHPPPPEVALRSIRSVIKPIQKEQEYRLLKQLNGRSTGTRIEQHLFSMYDVRGQKVSVKAKTLDRIPLLRDMAMMTDPVPDDFFAHKDHPLTVHYGSSKLSSDDGKRSLKRIKHTQTFHLGTAERRKKKSLHKSQDQLSRSTDKVNSLPNHSGNPEQHKVRSPSPVLVIKSIDIGDKSTENTPHDSASKETTSSSTATSSTTTTTTTSTTNPFGDRKDWADIESLMALFESAFNSNGTTSAV